MSNNTLAIIDSNNHLETQPAARRLDQNPALVYLGKLTTKARRVQLDALNVIANIIQPGANYLAIPFERIEYQHAQKIRAELVERYSTASVNRILSALRETVKQAWLLGLIPADQYLRLAEVENVRGSTLPAGRELQPGEINALLNACINDPTPAGYRDAAIIALMVTVGPRRDEVANMDLKDFNQETGQIKITGKGNKQRSTYLVNGTLDAMLDWLTVRGPEPGPLFIPVNKSGKMKLDRLTNQAVYNMLAKRGAEGKVSNFSPHDCRRTFISDMLEAGADIATVAKMAGHSSVTTTARYDRRPEQAKQKAAGLLHLPYTRRLTS